MKSDNTIRNGTSIFVGIIVAIAAFVHGALLLPLLLVACSVWGLYVLHHLRGSLPEIPKKKEKAPRRAKFVVPDIEDEPLSDILLLHVNQRVTAALRTAGSNITWEWATKDPLAIVKEGGRCLIRVHGLDGFESAEVVLDKQAHLRCELINTVPLRPNPTADATEKPRIPAETPPLPDPRMLLGIGPYKDHERYLTRSLEITNTLETMVQDILTISRLETAGADFKKDHLDCVQIIKAYLNETADLIAEKDLQIHLDILPSAFINGNKMLVEKVFSNLIGNAIKYSPQRADIWISVLMKHEQIVFSVENAGVHIPENSIPRLFDAFYRVEQSRSRKTGGSGLGLYIVQEILHQYGSECTVCNTQAGVKFSFII